MALKINHPFGSLVVAGVAGIYLIHICVNVGMVLGLLPVIGIPLPFLSYGGSALLANTVLLGLALNLYARRMNFPCMSSVIACTTTCLPGIIETCE